MTFDRPNVQNAWDRLEKVLLPLQKVAIACSGGVDSTVLAVAASKILGFDQVLLLTAEAPMVPESDRQDASELAHLTGATHFIVTLPVTILDQPPFSTNPPDRCYHCKKIIFKTLIEQAIQLGFRQLCDGTNADDLGEYRPGLQALHELQVISPLAAAGLTKSEIRELGQTLCPDYAAKPAMACLATRIPTYTPVTLAAMQRIDLAEQLLRQKGLHQVRVRDHGGLARVELDAELLNNGLDAQFIHELRDILVTVGFTYSTIDLNGYRSGSMNPESLKD
ncbi:MAG: ATP-dependent sacrificial sulfur transferase LarE [Eubacteriales bacterium]|nr:ATP-dependent sacrificial sulfur transferase LarE [Eubacteriales bacterium]